MLAIKRFPPLLRAVLFFLPVSLAMTSPAWPATEIRVWHAMRGVAAETLTDLTARFNAGQSEIHVILESKGTAADAVNAGLDATRDGQGPHLLQVQDELSGQVARARAARPLDDVLPLVKAKDFEFFVPGTVTFMKDSQGRLFGFPLQASVPVFLYNKDAYVKAGLDPEAPPRTWRDLQAHLLALSEARITQCPYTTSWPAWIHVENLGAWHGEPIATRNNGLDGPGAQLSFNDLLHVRHTALMMSWVKSRLFIPHGRNDEADATFASGECATITTASAALGDLMQSSRFRVGVAPLPFYEEGAVRPAKTFVGGSSLWVMNGKSRDEYTAVAQYLAWLSTPVISTEWHERTLTLPLTSAVYQTASRTGFYDRIPGLAGIMREAATTTSPVTRGIRLPNYDEVRKIIDAELESVWAGEQPPKQGLDDAVRLGNAAMLDATSTASTARTANKPLPDRKTRATAQ